MIKGKKVDDKRKERERDLSDKNRFEILLEDIRHEFKAVGEGHGILLAKIEDGNRKSEERDNNLEGLIKFSVKVLHEKIDNVEVKLTEKIDGVDKRLINVERDVGVLKQDVKSMNNRLTNVEQKVDKMDNRLINVEQKVDKMDNRLINVEQKVDKMDNRLINVEQKVDKVDAKLDKVIGRQDKQEVRQDEQDAKMDEVYHKVFAEGAGF